MDLMAEVVVAHLFPLDLNVHYLTYQAMLENVWTHSPFTMNVDEVNENISMLDMNEPLNLKKNFVKSICVDFTEFLPKNENPTIRVHM